MRQSGFFGRGANELMRQIIPITMVYATAGCMASRRMQSCYSIQGLPVDQLQLAEWQNILLTLKRMTVITLI